MYKKKYKKNKKIKKGKSRALFQEQHQQQQIIKHSVFVPRSQRGIHVSPANETVAVTLILRFCRQG